VQRLAPARCSAPLARRSRLAAGALPLRESHSHSLVVSLRSMLHHRYVDACAWKKDLYPIDVSRQTPQPDRPAIIRKKNRASKMTIKRLFDFDQRFDIFR
jgi:hypothetical protein